MHVHIHDYSMNWFKLFPDLELDIPGQVKFYGTGQLELDIISSI